MEQKQSYEIEALLMVLAALIISTAFTVMANPPGGICDGSHGCKPGVPIMAYSNPRKYHSLKNSSAVAVILSVTVLFFVLFGFPLGPRAKIAMRVMLVLATLAISFSLIISMAFFWSAF